MHGKSNGAITILTKNKCRSFPGLEQAIFFNKYIGEWTLYLFLLAKAASNSITVISTIKAGPEKTITEKAAVTGNSGKKISIGIFFNSKVKPSKVFQVIENKINHIT